MWTFNYSLRFSNSNYLPQLRKQDPKVLFYFLPDGKVVLLVTVTNRVKTEPNAFPLMFSSIHSFFFLLVMTLFTKKHCSFNLNGVQRVGRRWNGSEYDRCSLNPIQKHLRHTEFSVFKKARNQSIIRDNRDLLWVINSCLLLYDKLVSLFLSSQC